MANLSIRKWGEKLPAHWVGSAQLWLYGLFKIPLLFFIRPSVVELSEEKTVIKVPLKRRTKNHLNSMYFGVLCAAADCAGGLAAMQCIQRSGRSISLAFKDFHADFKKRAEGDTFFCNRQGKEIQAFVDRVIASGERQHMQVEVIATTPSKLGDEPVAVFTLTLSLKEIKK